MFLLCLSLFPLFLLPPWWLRALLPSSSGKFWIPGAMDGDFNILLTGRVTVLMRDVGSRLWIFWTARLSRPSIAYDPLSPWARRDALLGEGVLSGLGFDLSLVCFVFVLGFSMCIRAQLMVFPNQCNYSFLHTCSLSVFDFFFYIHSVSFFFFCQCVLFSCRS